MMRARLAVICATIALGLGALGVSQGAVDLTWRPSYRVLRVGESVSVGLYAASESGNTPVSAMDVVMTYDPAYLHFYRITRRGCPYMWLLDGFFSPSPDDINVALDDGDMMYTAWAQLGIPAIATRSGLLVITLEFLAAAPTCRTVVDIPVSLGGAARTRVFDGTIPNVDITGRLSPARVMVVPSAYLISVAEAKALADDSALDLGGPIVTRVFESYFYVEDFDRTAGIRVNCDPSQLPAEGATPTITGTISTISGERVINASAVSAGCPMEIPGALAMNSRAVRVGLSAVGLLIKIAGTVRSPSPDAFTLGDGGDSDVRVELHGVKAPPDDSFVAVTGALGADVSGPILRVNKVADIQTYP